MLHRSAHVLAGLRLPLLLGLAALQAGCRNECQELCLRLADYAVECGQSVPEAEIDACVEQEASASDKKVCRDFGDVETIRNEWTCDDLAVYWGSETAVE